MKKESAARRAALAGVMGAISVAALYLSSVLPTVKLACLAVTTFCCAVLVDQNEYFSAAICFAGVSLLGLLLIPDKLRLLPYVGFFGWYPIAKGLAEKLPRVFAWIIKLAVYAAGFFALIAALEYLVPVSAKIPVWAAGLIGAAIFVVCDIFLDMCLKFYRERIGYRTGSGSKND